MTNTPFDRRFVLACCGVISVFVVILTRALVYGGVGKTKPLYVVMMVAAVTAWTVFWLWFREFAPVQVTLAFVSFLVSRALRLTTSIFHWNDSLSFHFRDELWIASQILVVIAFSLLAYVVWRSKEVPIFVPIVLILYCAVSLVRVVLAFELDLPAYSALTFIRNLFGGLSYVCLGVYFGFEALGRREATRVS